MSKKVRISVGVLLITVIVFSAAIFANAQSSDSRYYSNGEYIYEICANGKVSIHCYVGEETDVTVPTTIEGRAVESVNSLAFYGADIKKLTVSEGITTLCDEAFFYCPSLEEVLLPSTIKTVGQGVFRDCMNLRKVTFGGESGSLGQFMFYGCINLTSLNLPNSVRVIPVGAFSYCKGLKSVNLPENLEIVYDFGFYASGLLSVDLPEKLSYIYDRAFAECTKLGKINGTDREFAFVADNAFENCIAEVPGFTTTPTQGEQPTAATTDPTEYVNTTASPATSQFVPPPPVEPTTYPATMEPAYSDPTEEPATATPTTSTESVDSTVHEGYYIGDTDGFYSFESSQIASAKVTSDTRRQELLELAFNVRNLGDANNDGRVNIKDATQIQKFVALMISENPRDFIYKNADVDTDGKITVRDATKIQKYSARIISSFI